MSSDGIRRLKTLALGLAALLAMAVPGSAAILPAFTADERYASIMVDAESGRVLAASNADQVLHPASLTKIMTLYMTFDALKQGRLTLAQQVRTSAHAAAMTPSSSGFGPATASRSSRRFSRSSPSRPTTPRWCWPRRWRGARKPSASA